MIPAPIVLFTYSRPIHTKLTVESLLCNINAEKHDLIVYSDAARTPKDSNAVNNVRDYLKKIKGFRSIKIIYRNHNFGLSKSIISGVTEVLQHYENIIVLEDDMITSKYFLTYMNNALLTYANDNRVICISGYVYPTRNRLPESFFLRGADCWGWATWRRGWLLFNENGEDLLNELKDKYLLTIFNFNNTFNYSKMLQLQINGLNDSWAIRWYASAFLANKLTLYPCQSFVHNIGNDSSGTHCSTNSTYDVSLSTSLINFNGIEVVESEIGRREFEDFFRSTKLSILSRLFNLIKRFF